MELSAELQNALNQSLAKWSTKSLAGAVSQLSDRYRDGGPGPTGRFTESALDVAAYVAYRLPATYAAVSAVLEEVSKLLPGFNPHTLLDVGAGPGTTLWAASQIWPSITNTVLLERDPQMTAWGQRLAAYANTPALSQTRWESIDLNSPWQAVPADLVTASYVLGELPEARLIPFVAKLWEHTLSTLVLVEPGTPEGFKRIIAARQSLLTLGAGVVAPCPHQDHCQSDWCHFATRVARSRIHRQAKASTLAYEDEKFSYLVVSRSLGLPITGRIVRHPQIAKGHIKLELCTPAGLIHETVTKKAGERYRLARHARWGDAFPSKTDPHP